MAIPLMLLGLKSSMKFQFIASVILVSSLELILLLHHFYQEKLQDHVA